MNEHPPLDNSNYNIEANYSFSDFAKDVAIKFEEIESSRRFFSGELSIAHEPYWVVMVIIGCLSGIAYVSSYHRKRFNLLLKTVFNWKIAKQIIRYEKVYTHPVNIILNSVFFLSTSILFGLLVQSSLNISFSLAGISFIIGVSIIGFFLIKLFIHKSIAWLFSVNEAIEEYIFQSNLMNKLYGITNLILLIIGLFTIYSTREVAYVSIVLLLVILVFQIIRGIFLGLEKGIQIQLIILYLCTLEILPSLLIIKMIS